MSLLVQGFTNGFLNLPSLTEISNGRAVFVSTSGTCGFLNVLWTDILSNGGPPDYSMSGCTTPSSGKPAACHVLYHVMSCEVM